MKKNKIIRNGGTRPYPKKKNEKAKGGLWYFFIRLMGKNNNFPKLL
jgi:hypothetical protein